MKIGVIGPGIREGWYGEHLLQYPQYGMECKCCYETRDYKNIHPVIKREGFEAYNLRRMRPNLEMHKTVKEIVKSSELVHVWHVAFPSSALASVMSKVYKKPLVVTTADGFMHRTSIKYGLKGISYKFHPSLSWKLADKIVAYSNQEMRWLSSLNKNYSSKIVIVPLTIDYGHWESYYKKYENDGEQKDFVEILCVARISPDKNLYTLLKSLLKINMNAGNVKCTIIGRIADKKYYREISNLIRSTELKGHINVITDFLNHDDLFKYYSRADLFILLSNFEQFGTVILEAMSCELPIIVSERVGTAEIVEKHNCGILVDPKNEQMITGAILKMVEDETYRNTLGKRGKIAVRDNYTWEHMILNLKNIYEEILSKYD